MVAESTISSSHQRDVSCIRWREPPSHPILRACVEYFVSGKKLCAFYMITCIYAYYAYEKPVYDVYMNRDAQPKHYRTAMRAFLPTAVLY